MPSNLIAVIKEKQEAIAKLQAELDEARALLTGAPIPRPGVVARRPQEQHPPVPPAARRKLATPHRKKKAGFKAEKGEIVPTSSVGRMVTVLRRAGKPLHVNEVLRQIESEGHKINKATLVGNLSRYIKKERVFYRDGPSVFGLIETRR